MSRLQIEIFIGMIIVLISAVVLVIYGVLENDRMDLRGSEIRGEAIEKGAELFESNCAACHGDRGKGITGIAPPLTEADFYTERMEVVGWNGTLEDYIISTVSSGRRVSTRPELYVGAGVPAMPAWSQQFGGPLRTDQIRDIAAYILSWEELAIAGGSIEVLATPTPVEITPESRGQALYAQLGCGACHTITGISAGALAPNLTQIGTVAETRIDGYTAEDYITESILDPNAYVVEGFQPDLMPQTFGEQLSDEELSDLVAFLLAQQ
ncbi:MAG: c-type cytochrome [Anaerolineales bacterium]|nr:c-type cytochrome [Anaerolineales bacterium]